MVHAEDIEYQFGWWAQCYKHPEYRNDRNHYPDAIALITGLDGRYHKSLFANLLSMSAAPRPRSFLSLWQDLIDNWDYYDNLFKQRFINRYKYVKRELQEYEQVTVESNPEDDRELLRVMESLNDNYLHLNVNE